MFPELFAHQEWADSIVWSAIDRNDAAKSDTRIRDLLAHMHGTQHAFYAVWTKGELNYRAASSFASLDELLQYAHAFHSRVHDFVASVTDIDRPAVMPWARRFRKDAVDTTMRDTLMQLPMHSTYHRGQINARLREVGGEPPLTDYIGWIWMARPAPQWPG